MLYCGHWLKFQHQKSKELRLLIVGYNIYIAVSDVAQVNPMWQSLGLIKLIRFSISIPWVGTLFFASMNIIEYAIK